jgi:hypothetical protein
MGKLVLFRYSLGPTIIFIIKIHFLPNTDIQTNAHDTVILSFLKRERDFAIVSDRPKSLTFPGRPTFLTVFERFMTISELIWS